MTDTGENSTFKSIDDDYEDDFEQDINSESTSERVKDQNGNDASVEKGQTETQNNVRKEKSADEASDSEPDLDADNYNFTEDQKRAMMELMVQKQEDSDLLDEEPPEYNVKGRLEQLNAELANEPTPVEGDREAKVGFKSEIVDLVAPPPTFSDDESSQPNSARGDTESKDDVNKPAAKSESSKSDTDDTPQYDKYSDGEDNKEKQIVVEREGNFEVVGINDLTASERAMYAPEEDEDTKDNKDNQNHKRKENTSSSSSSSPSSKSSDSSSSVNPRPPNQPRPNTATVGARRTVRPAQSPRPKSANNSCGSNTSLDNFNYNSPYAMTPEQKDQAKQLAKKQEEERMEKEKRKKEEDEEKRKDNEHAFSAWLAAKKEEDDRKRQNGEKNSQQSDKKDDDGAAFISWLKEKRNQGKKDKLLKRRQQQEMMETYRTIPKEESDKAFKEWLKKKNAALRHQQEMERNRNRLYNLQVKRSKKSQALVKAMKESQSFRYVDYYGYRF